ncbi:cytochrome-c oxidase, cbb3-type subunit III [Simiduia aestuariiviva]|uniref:Cbb3-type cytochrome c oxidase subunit n=1 Tax=Simiduia aestuariiviva TaxID=1510459 RepID=A0A839UND2_9GAMM|nr:cytochrome-c oxidase, cbb3-type subunit III [Simiduia aestuariiviva]MBB3169352.1 cytochrome c oxidase cbb3-type subunit 3 [Simiduia aestuariiviva]
MSTFWSLWITLLTLACLVLVTWVLFANRKVAVSDEDDPENRTTGHVYDGIEEYDNPLPKWWFQLFVATLFFTAAYLIAYPGLGAWEGVLGWTSHKQLAGEQQKAQAKYVDTFGKYEDMSIEELVNEPRAMKMGGRLFSNNCAICHGADGGGSYGFPSLIDKDWLYGGTPEKIKETLVHGRKGAMPAWGAMLGETAVQNSAEYVLSLSGQEHDAAMAKAGAQVFAANCASCHQADGTGNYAFGAPNLTDNIWLYDGSRKGIRHSIREGRANEMPAQKDKLRADKIHLLAAYVYSLSLDSEAK